MLVLISIQVPTAGAAGTEGSTPSYLGGGWALDDPRLSQPLYDEVIETLLQIPTRAVFSIATTVYRPKVPAEVNVPLVLVYSPVASAASVYEQIGRFLVPRGYALAIASAPGTGGSGGCYDMGGKLERSSLADVIAALARKGWSTGRVGMYGQSEAGTDAQMALATGQRHLWTIVSIAGSSDLYAQHFVNGVESIFDVASVHTEAVSRSPRFCDAGLLAQWRSAPSSLTGVKDDFWRERDYAEQVSRIIVPRDSSALIVQGLSDGVSSPSQLPPWLDALDEAQVHTKVIVGHWAHEHPFASSSRAAWRILLLRWYDHWLKGAPTEVEGLPGALIEDENGVWRTEGEWPPARAESTRLFLSADGRLRRAHGEGTSTFIDNGAAPDRSLPVSPQASHFRTKPSGEGLRISGQGLVHLRLSHSSPTGHVAVTLYRIDGDHWKPLTHGLYSYNVRKDINRFNTVQPGEIFELTIPLSPLETNFPIGSRIGISIGSQAEGMQLNGSPMVAPPSGGTTQLFHGRISFLELPVIDGIVPR